MSIRKFISWQEEIAVAASIGDHAVITSSANAPEPLTHGDYTLIYCSATIGPKAAGDATHLTIPAGYEGELYVSFNDAQGNFLDFLNLGEDRYDVAQKLGAGGNLQVGPIILAPQVSVPFFMSAARGFPVGTAQFTLDAQWIVHNDEAVAHAVIVYMRALVEETPGRISDAV